MNDERNPDFDSDVVVLGECAGYGGTGILAEQSVYAAGVTAEPRSHTTCVSFVRLFSLFLVYVRLLPFLREFVSLLGSHSESAAVSFESPRATPSFAIAAPLPHAPVTGDVVAPEVVHVHVSALFSDPPAPSDLSNSDRGGGVDEAAAGRVAPTVDPLLQPSLPAEGTEGAEVAAAESGGGSDSQLRLRLNVDVRTAAVTDPAQALSDFLTELLLWVHAGMLYNVGNVRRRRGRGRERSFRSDGQCADRN
jgi:hypothetical protein